MARPLALLALALSSVPALAGCQTAMSVEEAKRVTAAFAGAAFVPPPRTISDITAILDQQQRTDVGAADEARERADQAPPAAADPQVLRQFYFRRGLAAREIGRTRQEIDDLTTALGYAPRSADPYQYSVLWALRSSEMRAGNAPKSVEYGRQAVDLIPDSLRGDVIVFNGYLATTLASMGDLKAAEATLAAAERVYFESLRWGGTQRPEWLVNRRVAYLEGLAAVAGARGRHGEAERLYREGIALRLTIPEQAQQLGIDELRAFLARALIRQGRLLEAENEARAALLGALAKRGRYSAHTAFILSYLVWVIHEQARYREAEVLARARIDILEKIGTAPESGQLAYARGQLAGALSAQGRNREALSEYETVRAGLAGDPPELKRLLGGHLGYGYALLVAGQADRALEIFEVARQKSRLLVGDNHRNTASIRGMIAMARVARGERAAALADFREAAGILLAPSPDADEESGSRAADQRLAGFLTRYIRLLAEVHGTPLEREARVDAAAEAFRLADVVRGRSVQRALDAGAVRAAARTPALADLVRGEQDVKKQMAAMHGLLGNVLSAPSDQQDQNVVQDIRSQVATLRRAREGLLAQIARDFPAYAELLTPRPLTLAEARASLRPGEALLSTLVTVDRVFVWAIPHDGPVAFAAAPVSRRELAESVKALRAALDPGVTTLGDIPPFDVERAHALYRQILEPVRAGWERAGSLLVVAHGPLAQLPLGMLVTRPARLGPEEGPLFANYRAVPWLARTHAVTLLPSVTALRTLRTLPPGDPNRRPFVGFGDPIFSTDQARRSVERSVARIDTAAATRGVPITLRDLKIADVNSARLALLPRLPDTADEILGIAAATRADPARDVFLGARANEHSVKTTDLAGYKIVAFATHGLVPGDLDGLTQPALALSAPEVARVEGDGLLTMEEILGLRLNADWVVLSACNTASGQGAGSEAISGLGRAFFYAGARALLVSNWPVETTSARALTTDLFRRQGVDPALTRAQALQQTMNGLIDEGQYVDPRTRRVVFSYAHPIFWAPFTLVGDGGGGAAAK